MNIGGRITAALNNAIRMTVDAYGYRLGNRIVASGRFDTTSKQVRDIRRPFPDITQVQFYVNSISTKTKGVDIVLNGNWKIKNAALMARLGAN
jgi:iron complex outermembrane receptor protein